MASAQLPRLGKFLPDTLLWPDVEDPLVVCARRDVSWDEHAVPESTDFLFIEVSDGARLAEVATKTLEWGLETVVFAAEGVPTSAIDAALAVCPSMRVVPFHANARDSAVIASQWVAEAVRRRVWRHAIACWSREWRAYDAVLLELDPTWRARPVVSPALAPLEAVEFAHVLALVGTWFAKPKKVTAELDIGYAALVSLVARAKARATSVLKEVRTPATAHVLVLERESSTADLVASSLRDHEDARSTRLVVRKVRTVTEARAVVAEDAPVATWIDAGAGSPSELAQLHAALRSMGRAFVSAWRVDGGSASVARAVTTSRAALTCRSTEPAALRPVASRLCLQGSAIAELDRVSRLLSFAEGELAPMPDSVGRCGVTLESVLATTVACALELEGGVRERAARALGTTAKVLAGIARESAA